MMATMATSGETEATGEEAEEETEKIGSKEETTIASRWELCRGTETRRGRNWAKS